MNKKLIIIFSLVAVFIIGLVFAKGDLLQGRLRLFQSQKLSSTMQRLCIKPEQYDEKQNEQKEEDTRTGEYSGGETSREDSNTRSSDGRDSKEKDIIIDTPTITIGGNQTGGTVAGNEIEEETNTTESEPEITEDGSKEKPFVQYADCKCGEEGKDLGTYQDEQGTYYSKICIAPPFWQCVRPQYKCPEGTSPDFIKISEICKKEKAKSCFSAAKPGGQTYGMCKALADWVFDLDCVSESECKEYLGMSEKELDNYIQALGLPEEFFAKGGDESYKPKNAKEKKSIEEVDKINDCYNLYK